MINLAIIITVLKYAACVVLVLAVMCMPAWLAMIAKRNKHDTLFIRMLSFVFGWTIVGWLWALFNATKK